MSYQKDRFQKRIAELTKELALAKLSAEAYAYMVDKMDLHRESAFRAAEYHEYTAIIKWLGSDINLAETKKLQAFQAKADALKQ